jgi:hypothetical protein
MAVAVAPLPAFATTCGSTSVSNWHVGWKTDRAHTSRTDIYGVYARIDVQQAGQCTGGSNKFSNVYAMLHDDLSQSSLGWAQSGFEKDPVNGVRNFAQVASSVGLYTWYSANPIPVNQANDYKSFIAQIPGGVVGSYVNGDVKVASATSGWDSPYELEYSGESRYRESDIPGVLTDHVVINLNQFYSSNTWSWQSTPCGIFDTYNQSPNHWYKNETSCTQRHLWTDPTN